MDDINYQEVIEHTSELKLYKVLTYRILEYLENSGPSVFWDLVRFVGGSDRRILRLLNQMDKIKLLSFKNGYFTLNSKTKPPIPSREVICPRCKARGVIISNALKKVARVMTTIYKERPKPTFIFNQRPVTLDTTIQRVAYAIYRGDLQNKKVAVIGDDDLTSLAIALSSVANRVTVFEIDQRFINFIRAKSTLFKLNLEVVKQDLTKNIPSKYTHKFDIFLTDPTPTPIPFALFINVGLKLLKDESGRVGYTSIYSSGMKKTLKLQEIFLKMNLLITDVIPHFTEYEFIKETYSNEDIKLLKKYEIGKNKKRLSFFEHLVRFETTEKTTKMPLEFKLREMIGSATERVLIDLNKDPASFGVDKDKQYIKRMAKSIIKDKEKEIKL